MQIDSKSKKTNKKILKNDLFDLESMKDFFEHYQENIFSLEKY